MRPQVLDALKAFVGPRYAARDAMHDYAHVVRVLEAARTLAGDDPNLDEDLLVFGAHLHGVVGRDEAAVRAFLAGLDVDGERIERILQVARESLEETEPVTPEGAVLHDAHLTEGGPAFSVIKALYTGRERGRTDLESAAFLRDHVLGRYRCVTPTGRQWYAENERYTRFFLNRLAPRLAREEGQPALPEGPDPYAGEPTVGLTCPWCSEGIEVPACLVGNDVPCPECLGAIYLAPALRAGGAVGVAAADVADLPRLRRCPRCRSGAVWRPPLGLVGGLLIGAAVVWLAYTMAWEGVLLHPYADPLVALLILVGGVEVLLRPAAYRCRACGHRWRRQRRAQVTSG